MTFARRLVVTGVAAAGVMIGSGGPAGADATSPGHYCSKYDGVAIRTEPDGTARDNLALNQTFQVERIAGTTGRWVYGYKIVNGVHGYVLSTSLNPC